MRKEREREKGSFQYSCGIPAWLSKGFVTCMSLCSSSLTLRIHLLITAAVGAYKFITEEHNDKSYVSKFIVDETGVLILFLDYRNPLVQLLNVQ